MKRVTIAVLILLGVLVASVGNGIYLTRSTQEVSALLEKTTAAIGEEDWASALTLTEEAEQCWMAANFYHHIVLHVDSLEEISVGFGELRQFLQAQDEAEAAVASDRLANRLRMTAYAEQLRLENIF